MNKITEPSEIELVKFDIKEFVDRCDSERELEFIFSLVQHIKRRVSLRPRTDEERKARADLYGCSIKDICK